MWWFSTTENLCFVQVQSSKEDAIASMQAYKAGLSKHLASREESLRAGHARHHHAAVTCYAPDIHPLL